MRDRNPTASNFDLIVILSGKGELVWDNNAASYQAGECWLIPAAQGHLGLRPTEQSKMLRTYVPDLAALRADLKRAGHSWQEIEKTVFD